MKSILQIARRELLILATRPIYWFCMIAAPLFCYIFFTTLMSAGLPTDMPLGLVDNDNTSTTRSLARNLDAFQMTGIAHQYASVTEAREAVQRGDIYGFYYIPKGTTREAQRQEVPTVSFYTNYSYLVAGSLLYRDMRTMSELASGAASRTVLYAKGATERQAMAYLQPVVIDTHPVGNPWLNYNVYLSNTILPGLLMLFIFMVTVYSIGTEVKRGSMREWLNMADGSMAKALTGKLMPQSVVFLLMGALYVGYLYGYCHFPCNCGLPVMLVVMALGVLAAQGMGVFMYAMLPSLRMGLSFASLWGVISFSICGMSFPTMAMHPMLQGLSYLFPLRHYFLLYVNCALDGYPLLNAWPYVVGLLVFIALPVLLLKRLKKVVLTVPYIP
ncbi:MAG: ABC transporter permease [Bacteroidales bacterium]|nr:ABC transporter permease [Bacteroidales bacterium]